MWLLIVAPVPNPNHTPLQTLPLVQVRKRGLVLSQQILEMRQQNLGRLRCAQATAFLLVQYDTQFGFQHLQMFMDGGRAEVLAVGDLRDIARFCKRTRLLSSLIP